MAHTHIWRGSCLDLKWVRGTLCAGTWNAMHLSLKATILATIGRDGERKNQGHRQKSNERCKRRRRKMWSRKNCQLPYEMKECVRVPCICQRFFKHNQLWQHRPDARIHFPEYIGIPTVGRHLTEYFYLHRATSVAEIGHTKYWDGASMKRETPTFAPCLCVEHWRGRQRYHRQDIMAIPRCHALQQRK